MQSVLVELDTNTQLEALKNYIQSLGAKMRILKEEEIQMLCTKLEMMRFGASLRKHSSKVLSDFVNNEAESMF